MNFLIESSFYWRPQALLIDIICGWAKGFMQRYYIQRLIG